MVTFAAATYYPEPSHTFSEYLLLPNLTRKTCTAASISLATPLAKFRKGEKPAITLNMPFASAIMPAVSGCVTGIALARSGGIAFIFVSQPVEKQAEMVERLKKFKAGFVASDSNIRPDATLEDVMELRGRTGHTTIAVTEDGTATGKLVGFLTSRDYRFSTTPRGTKVSELIWKR